MDKENFLVLGNGYLGNEFKRQGYEVWGRDIFDFAIEKYNGDHDIFLKEWNDKFKKYNIIVNCIGQSNTRYCESKVNINKVLSINGYLPSYLSTFCKTTNKIFVHISTGCLYDEKINLFKKIH
jgi:dTDP-4-dehydrorhamnose reductase